MHAETLALLTKPLCFPNMKYCHGNTIILRIVLKSPQNITFNYKMINFPNIYMLGMLLYVIYKLQFNVKFNNKRFAKRFKMFLKLNCLLSVNIEFEN